MRFRREWQQSFALVVTSRCFTCSLADRSGPAGIAPASVDSFRVIAGSSLFGRGKQTLLGERTYLVRSMSTAEEIALPVGRGLRERLVTAAYPSV